MIGNADPSTIRPVQASDEEAVWKLLTQFATSYRPLQEVYATQFTAILKAVNARFYVAERHSLIVGYVLAFYLPVLYANGSVCEICELMVDPQHRNTGVGRTLVQAIAEEARQAGVKEVTVSTRRAGDYYRKLGFTESATYFKLILSATD